MTRVWSERTNHRHQINKLLLILFHRYFYSEFVAYDARFPTPALSVWQQGFFIIPTKNDGRASPVWYLLPNNPHACRLAQARCLFPSVPHTLHGSSFCNPPPPPDTPLNFRDKTSHKTSECHHRASVSPHQHPARVLLFAKPDDTI